MRRWRWASRLSARQLAPKDCPSRLALTSCRPMGPGNLLIRSFDSWKAGSCGRQLAVRPRRLSDNPVEASLWRTNLRASVTALLRSTTPASLRRQWRSFKRPLAATHLHLTTMKRVAVFGLGYVGCVTAACLSRDGHFVVGVDVDGDKVAEVNAGLAPLSEPGLDDMLRQEVR